MAPVTPPTLPKRNVSGAISLGVATTFGVAAGTMALLWHDLPLSPKPDGAMTQHIGFWAKCGGHALLPHVHYLSAQCTTYTTYLGALVDNGGAWGLGLRVAASATIGLWAGGYVSRRAIIPRDALIHVRGFQKRIENDALTYAQRKCAEEIQLDERMGIVGQDLRIHPELRLAQSRWARHIFVAGGIGGGKTQILLPIAGQIIERDDRALIFDIKRDFTAYFKNAAILAATDARSWAWDIARDIATPQAAQQFCKLLIEDSKDPFWAAAGRALLTGYIMMLSAERGDDWGFPELRQALMTPDTELADIMRAYNPVALKAVEQARGNDAATNQTTKSIQMTMQTFCAPIYDLATAWAQVPRERRWSAVDWVTDRKLVAHGAAPLDNIPGNPRSYFVTTHDALGETRTYWGAGLERALAESRAKIGDPVDVKHLDLKSPIAQGQAAEAAGPIVGSEPHEQTEATWVVRPLPRHRQIILQGDFAAESLTRAYISQIYAIVCSRIGDLLEVKDRKKRTDGKSDAIWLFCDELPALGKIEPFERAIQIGRSKDVRFVAGFQSFEQLHHLYGKEIVNAWVGSVGTTIVTQVQAGPSATLICELIGKREVERPNWSASGGASGRGWTYMTSRDEIKVVHEAELSQHLGRQSERIAGPARRFYEDLFFSGKTEKQKRRHFIRALMIGFGDVLFLEWPFTSLPKKRRSFVRAAWVNARPAARKIQPKPAVTDADFVPAGDEDVSEEELERYAASQEMSDDEYNSLIAHTADYAMRLARETVARADQGLDTNGGAAAPVASNAASDAKASAAAIFTPGVDTGGRVGGPDSPERQREIERHTASLRALGALRERTAALTASMVQDSGLSDAPSRAPTTAARIKTFTFDPTLRPGLSGAGPEDDLSETAHATHELAEVIGQEAHLDAGQTEHLGQALLALDVLDSVTADDDASAPPPQPRGQGQNRGARTGLTREPTQVR